MKGKYQKLILEDLGKVGRGRSRHRPRNAEHLYGGPYPFIQTADVKSANNRITTWSQTYSEKGLAQSKLWAKDTLCITIAANIADAAILDMPACFPDSVIGFIPNPKIADLQYVKYLFDLLQMQIKQISQGAAQDNLSLEKLRSIKFPVPDLPSQQKIARRLSRYDDLIEVNLRRIRLLEELARVTYEEWFVRGRFPGWEEVEVDSDTNLPTGWTRKPLGTLVKVAKDVVSASDVHDETHYIGLEHIPRKSIALSSWETAEKVDSNKYLFEKFDILFGKIRPYFHKVGVVLTSGITSTDTIVLRPKASLHHGLVLQTVFSEAFVDTATQSSNGTKMPRANWKVLKDYPVIIPTEHLASSYSDLSWSIVKEIDYLAQQNTRLREARNLLLPRLMAGVEEA